MGLDISIYKVRKPALPEDTEITTLWLGSHNYEYETQESMESNERFSELIPYTTTIPVTSKLISLKSIAKDYGIKDYECARFARCKPGGVEVYNFQMEDGSIIDVCIHKEDIKNYIHSRTSLFNVWESEEIAYWRNDYGVRNAVHKMRPDTQNAEYKKLTEEQYLFLREHFPDGFDEEEYDPSYAYLYFEWY